MPSRSRPPRPSQVSSLAAQVAFSRLPVGMARFDSLLPAVGASYPSLDAFKRELYERCLQYSVNLAVSMSVPRKMVHLGCSLNGLDADERCSCQIICKLHSSSGGYKVDMACAKHDCGAEKDKENRAKARRKVELRLEKLKETEMEMSPRSRRSTSKGKGRALPSSDSSAASDSESSVEGSSSEDEDGRMYQPQWLGVYPSDKEVRIEIRQLCSIGPLAFPSTADTFPTARDLFTLLYAYASQRGFSIYRYGGTTTATSVTLLCERAHDRFRKTESGLCGWKVEVEKAERGWRVTRELDSIPAHNHEVVGAGQTRKARSAPRSSGTATIGLEGKGKQKESERKPPRKRRVDESDNEHSSSTGSSRESGSASESGSGSGPGGGSFGSNDSGSATSEGETTPARRPEGQARRGSPVVFDLKHPRAHDLKAEVDRLANLAPLDLPTASKPISEASYTKLRVHVIAAALQRGFKVSLNPSTLSYSERRLGTAFSLGCSKRAHTHSRCTMHVVIGKRDDGKWTIIRDSLKHNHALAEGISFKKDKQTDEGRSASAPKKPRTSVIVGPFATARKPTRGLSDQPPSRQPVASTSRDPAAPSSAQQPGGPPAGRPSIAKSVSPFATLTSAVRPPPSPALQPLPNSARSTPVPLPPAPTVQPAEHPFYPSLLAFLGSLSTSPAFLKHASFLIMSPTDTSYGAGLDGVAKLSLLLSLSEKELDRFVESLGRGEAEGKPYLPKVGRALLKKKVAHARRRALGIRESTEGSAAPATEE